MISEFLSSGTIYGRLYQLLHERLPAFRSPNGRLDVGRLAQSLEMTPEGVYLWLRQDIISRKGRDKLMILGDMAQNLMLLEDYQAFALNDFVEFC